MGRSSMRLGAVLATAAILLVASTPGSAQQGSPWCEANCKDLCRKIYGSKGAAECFATIPCSNYVGRQCAPAKVVEARYIVYCNSNKGKAGTTCR
jgi:hypothetical protein